MATSLVYSSPAYGGSLVAFMAAPATSQPMDTLHQLASSDYKVYFVKGSVQVPVDLL